MGLTYFSGSTWAAISREERFYCAILYWHIRQNPASFLQWLSSVTHLALDPTAFWEAGYEVCFYRDYLKSRNRSVRESIYSEKRTFDLCLFSDSDIVIVEAKVYEPFKVDQCRVFGGDIQAVKAVLEHDVRVHLLALASSKYLNNYKTYGRQSTLEVFHDRISWKMLSEHFAEPLFKQADDLYGT